MHQQASSSSRIWVRVVGETKSVVYTYSKGVSASEAHFQGKVIVGEHEKRGEVWIREAETVVKIIGKQVEGQFNLTVQRFQKHQNKNRNCHPRRHSISIQKQTQCYLQLYHCQKDHHLNSPKIETCWQIGSVENAEKINNSYQHLASS